VPIALLRANNPVSKVTDYGLEDRGSIHGRVGDFSHRRRNQTGPSVHVVVAGGSYPD
jgi:hypothetical protein